MSSDLLVDQIRGQDAEKRFSALEDQAFGVPAPGHYLDDFPVWDSERSSGPGTLFKVGAFDGSKLVAAAGARLAELRYPRAELPAALTVALIGAVATDAEYRGKGLATQLVSTAIQWATQRGATLAVLWGSEHDLYAKLGFAPCGTQATVPLSSLVPGTPDGAVSTGWVPGIFTAMKTRRSGLVLRDEDRKWVSSHQNVRWFWTGSPSAVSSFAALGRGIDLPHFVHEWGGETRELLRVLHHIHSLDSQAKLLGSPDLFRARGFQYDPSSEERLGLVRIIDATAVFRAVHARAAFSASWTPGTQVQGGVGSWKIGVSGANGKTVSDNLSPLELSKLFFGPVSPRIGKPWSEFFPLPLWLWGLDAV